MKSIFLPMIIIATVLVMPFITYDNACCGMDQESIAKHEQEVSQVEDLWKSGNIREYYSKASNIAKDIEMNSPASNLNTIAAKLFDNLISKEVKIEEVGTDDLSTMQKLASYLISYTNASGKDRQINARLLCKYLGKTRKEIIPDYKPKPVVANVPPPPGVPGFAGMSPEAIKDPTARSKYEASIRENQENNVMNRRQAQLGNQDREMTKPIMAYITETFHAGDISSDVLTECLHGAGFNDKEKEEVVNNIRSR